MNAIEYSALSAWNAGLLVDSVETVESQKHFGKLIRNVRTSANLSREQVSEEAGITPNYLGQIERGEKWPALNVIVAIAKALGVPPSAFFDFERENLSITDLTEKLNGLFKHTDQTTLRRILRMLEALLRA